MHNEILINATVGETRAAVLEKGTFVELHTERGGDRGVVGAIMKGRVTRVLPGMQAAFVDIGLEKAAFLYSGDYLHDSAETQVEAEEDAPRPRRRGRNGGARSAPKIESVLEEGQEILVQVAKEPIGTKGARITSHVSIPGRHLVLTPWSRRVGVSRRIGTDRERRRLRETVSRLRPPDLGFIIRTAGEDAHEPSLAADVRYLTEVWDDIEIRKNQVRAPAVLYQEPALPLRIVRDFVGSDTRRIVIDSPEVFERVRDFVGRFLADPKPRVELYQGEVPIYEHFGLEEQIERNLDPKVWLKSGGYLIIDQNEALTAIDVNTGRYVGRSDLEETVLRTNLEAVKEVVHQLRFRMIGGLIIIDLIDMESAENREKVYRALQDALRQDKAKTNLLKISELGLVEMTRKRTRESLVQTLCEPCPYCEGRGYVLSRESTGHKLLRELRKDLPRFCGRRVAVEVSRNVAELLLGPQRESLLQLEKELEREIEIRARVDLHQERFEIVALEEGPPVTLALPWLAEPAGEGRGDGEPAGAAVDEPAPLGEGPEAASSGDGGAPAGPQPAPPEAPAREEPEGVDANAESLILPPPQQGEVS